MGSLDKKSFLSRNRRVTEVSLPDGGSVFIKPLPASFFINQNGQMGNDFRVERLVANSLCDAQGQVWFSDGEEQAVLELSLADFNVLSQACLAANGLSSAGEDSGQDGEKNC